jgi:acetyl-CoA carboxylase biotin carboxyl carrier protein
MAKAGSRASDGLSFDTVVELLTMLDGSDLPTRIVYKDGPLRLEVERGTQAGPPAPVLVPAPGATPQTGSLAAAPSVAAPTGEAPAAAPTAAAATADPTAGSPAAAGDGEPVRAPIAGVFYRAPNPDADPFVELGQPVSADDVIGIVEVMKLMNTVRAGVAGTVVEICVENADLVEYEQVLVRIAPEA